MQKEENKRFQRNCHAFLTLIREKNRPKRIWVDKRTESAGEFQNLCEAEGIQIFFTMSETTTAFA